MIPLMPLLSLADAKEHLATPSENDNQIKQKISLATGIVMHHIKLEAIPDDWIVSDESPLPDIQPAGGIPREVVSTGDISILGTDDSPSLLFRVPAKIQTAVILVLTNLYEQNEDIRNNPLSQAVIDLLDGYRDPTFA